MHPLIPQSQTAIAALCRALAVRQLDLFGSAALTNTETAKDFDFLVDMEAQVEKSQARRLIELANGLEALLGSPVDVISMKSVRNSYFAKQVQNSRINIYERT